MSYPDNNPKTVFGVKKAPLHLIPPLVHVHEALAFNDGARKYDPFNWRHQPVSATIYVSAAKRHIDLWFDGEEFCPHSGVHHLGHARACLAILLDAQAHGTLNDDRPPAGQMAATLIMAQQFLESLPDPEEAASYTNRGESNELT